MAKQTIPLSERTYPRCIKAVKGDHTISFTTQPYITGMYIAVNDSKSSQLGQMAIPHSAYPKGTKGLINDLKKDGYELEIIEGKYIDFISENDLIEYEIFK